MTPSQTSKKMEEELEKIQREKNKCLKMNTCSVCDSPQGHRDIKSHIKSCEISQLEAVLLWAEKNKRNTLTTVKDRLIQNQNNLHYNIALSDITSFIRLEIIKIKKLK